MDPRICSSLLEFDGVGDGVGMCSDGAFSVNSYTFTVGAVLMGWAARLNTDAQLRKLFRRYTPINRKAVMGVQNEADGSAQAGVVEGGDTDSAQDAAVSKQGGQSVVEVS
jgi:hypothetical protein